LLGVFDSSMVVTSSGVEISDLGPI
jgi:hypothetical protein